MPTNAEPPRTIDRKRRPFLLFAVAWCVFAALVVAVNPNFRFQSGPDVSPFGGDFLQEWIGGHIVLHGDWSRFFDPEYAKALEHDVDLVGFQWAAGRYLPMVYPPFYYVVVSPLSILPVGVAAWFWAMLMMACWPLSFWFIHRGWNVARRGLQHSGSQATMLLPLFFAPMIESLVSCQKGTLILVFFSAAWYALRRGSPFCAGLIAGLLLFKPQFAIVLFAVMALGRQWRFLLGFGATALVLLGICLVMGTDVCLQYVAFARQAGEYIRTSGYAIEKSHCWYGFFTLLAGGRPDGWPRVATFVASVTTLGIAAWMWRGKLRVDRPRFGRQFAVAVFATLLISPHLFTYDLTLLALPMALIYLAGAGRSARLRRNAMAMVVAIFVVANVSVPLAQLCRVQLSTLFIFGTILVLSRPRAILRSAAKLLRRQRSFPWKYLPLPRLLRDRRSANS